jgi:hypothetical protein
MGLLAFSGLLGAQRYVPAISNRYILKYDVLFLPLEPSISEWACNLVGGSSNVYIRKPRKLNLSRAQNKDLLSFKKSMPLTSLKK